MKLGFWKIAMRPGQAADVRPPSAISASSACPATLFSSMVCTRLFIKPLIAALTGSITTDEPLKAVLGTALKANDQRQDYVRATLSRNGKGQLVATAFPKQDSSMQRVFREADGLIIRAPHAAAAKPGDLVDVLAIDF